MMPNDKSLPEPENVAQQETGGDCVSRLVRQSFVEWRDEGRMVIKGQKGTRDPEDGIVKFSRDQTREIPGNLWDDLGHECTDYDGDGY